MATNVLVIEDDQEINALIGEYLGLENFGYHKALSGQEGIALARAVRPDAIVLDLMLPDLDGYEVCRRLKSAPATVNIPVILLTCLCQDGDRILGYESGAITHMAKPFQPDALLQKVTKAVEARRMLDTHPMFGQLRLSGRNPEEDYAAINHLLGDLSYRCPFDDRTTSQLRQAFVTLERSLISAAAAAPAGTPSLTLDYAIRLSPTGRTDDGHPNGIYLTFSKTAAQPPATTAHAKPAAASAASTLGLDAATWEQFISLAGLQPVESAEAIAMVRVFRPIAASSLIPAMDGNVIPILSSKSTAVQQTPPATSKDKKPNQCNCNQN